MVLDFDYKMNEIIKHTEYHENRLKYSKLLSRSNSMLPYRYCFILTNKCNLNCKFCFQDRKGREGALTKEDWLNLIDQLPDYAHVTLTGGEPLVFKGFEEVFEKVTQKHTCNIISNGLMLNEDIMSLMVKRKNFTVLSISVDDIGNLNRDVKANQWEKMLQNLKILKKLIDQNNSKLIIDIKTVVLDTNAESLFQIYKFMKEVIKCNTHSFQILKGSPVQHADYTFKYESIFKEYSAYKYVKFNEILDQLEKVRIYNIKNKFISYTHPNYLNLNSQVEIKKQPNAYLINENKHSSKTFKSCNSPWESVHINVDGAVYPCLAIDMGNIKNNSLNEIFFNQKYNQFKEEINKCGTVNACNRCGYLKPLNQT